MSMHTRQIIRTGFGIFGQVTSFALFASPVFTMRTIYKKKDVEEFSPNPYLAGIMNCLMWVFYGLPFVTKSNTLVITINSVGLGLEIIYVAIYLLYAKTSKKRRHAGGVAAGISAAFTVYAVLILKLLHGSKREFASGLASTIFSICLYGMPLDILRTVIKTKSSEYLPIFVCAAGCLNGITWASYAVMNGVDYFILISNGLGAVLGAIQIIVWFVYRNGPKSGDSKPNQPKEVSMV